MWYIESFSNQSSKSKGIQDADNSYNPIRWCIKMTE